MRIMGVRPRETDKGILEGVAQDEVGKGATSSTKGPLITMLAQNER